MTAKKIMCMHGVAIATGVPALVLLSVGSVVGITGNAAAIVWPVAAVLGGAMALLYARLACDFPNQNGGFIAAAARVFETRCRPLSAVGQWSYWLGWAPSPAIYGSAIGVYVHDAFLPKSGPVTIFLIALAVIVSVFVVNVFGIAVTARIQAALAVVTLGAFSVLAWTPLAAHHYDVARAWPITPPGGWMSAGGAMAMLGGLFLAGWSAYGAEIALTYTTDYRKGCAAAVRALRLVAVTTVVAYTVFPLLLVLSLDRKVVVADPGSALLQLFQAGNGGFGRVVVLLALLLSMILTLNMTVIASSRLLGQMSKDGYCRLRLDRENRFGRPWRALSFDCLANVALLSVLAIVNLGSLASIPTALLAMANTGYFIAIIIGLLACAVAARSRAAGRRTVVSSIALATVNGIIFSAAGFVWGWPNIAIGLVCIIGAVAVLAPVRSVVLARGSRARRGEVSAL